MNRQIFDTRPRSLVNKGIAGISARFLSPAHRNPPSAVARSRTRLCAVCCCCVWALGATCAWAQTGGVPVAKNISVDVPIGGSAYTFKTTDFAFTDASGASLAIGGFAIEVATLPDRGILIKRSGSIIRIDNDLNLLVSGDFADGDSRNLVWVLPDDAISVTPNYTSFAYTGFSLDATTIDSSRGIITINLVVGSPIQQEAVGTPTVAGGTAISYRLNTPLTASIYGVADQNGIDTSTLAWQWQQAAAPSSGTSIVGVYGDIEDATDANFRPLAAHAGKYIRVCASFKDQHSTPNDEERCTLGLPVVGTSGSSLRLRLRLFLEGPLR